jgi:hypothetical protein
MFRPRGPSQKFSVRAKIPDGSLTCVGGGAMRTFLVVCGAILFLSLTSAAATDPPSFPEPSAQAAPAGFFATERGRFEVGINYQFERYREFGSNFDNNGILGSFNVHVFDPLTSVSWRLTAALEGAAGAGFGGQTGGTPNLAVKSVFVGGGPRLAIESAARLEPWVHLLVGWEHLRYTQTTTLGSNSAFGFIAGGGADIKLYRSIYWRVEADYLGTHFPPAPAIQSNLSVGTGPIITF